MKDIFKVGRYKFKSRLILGTGKYKNFIETAKAIDASGADMVTVAVRRVNIINKKEPLLMDYINPKKIRYLPNTAGCFKSDDALRVLRLARDSGGWNLVKLEVLGDKETLYPNMKETLKCTEILVREKFEVMVYCSDDPIACKQLEEIGAVAVMPLGSLIGSGRGIPNKNNIKLIKSRSSVPASIAMELGCDGVLVNTAIAKARKPILMAEAMKLSVQAGWKCYLSGTMQKSSFAKNSTTHRRKIK